MGDDPHKGASPFMQTPSNSSEPTAETGGRRRSDGSVSTEVDARRGEVLTTTQAAAALGVHERTVRRYLSSGLLACRRLPGGHYRIPAEALTEFWHANDPSGRRHRHPGRRAGGTPDSPRTDRERRSPSRSPRSRLRLGEEAPRDYDLSTSTLRTLRARLS
jgi:excisionase family DNA binding protein